MIYLVTFREFVSIKPFSTLITLENLAYTIPEGAENLQLYVESPDSLTDFYVDAVSGAERADS